MLFDKYGAFLDLSGFFRPTISWLSFYARIAPKFGTFLTQNDAMRLRHFPAPFPPHEPHFQISRKSVYTTLTVSAVCKNTPLFGAFYDRILAETH